MCKSNVCHVYDKSVHTTYAYIRETRQSTHMALTIPFAKKNCYATSFAVNGANMWNDLPPQLRTITCLNSFKRELRKTFVHITVQA